MDKTWSVYMLKCNDGTLYTGVTNDVAKRVKTHNESPRGAKYTKARRPVILVYEEGGYSRGEALSREAKLRKLSRKEKDSLLVNF